MEHFYNLKFIFLFLSFLFCLNTVHSKSKPFILGERPSEIINHKRPLNATKRIVPNQDGILFVDKNTTNTDLSGDSWATAIKELYIAIGQAQSDQNIKQIWVAKGTYFPSNTGDRFSFFKLPSGVKLIGGFAGTETSAEDRNLTLHKTILSGDLFQNDQDNYFGNYDNSLHILYLKNVNDQTLVDGFTFTSGCSNGISFTDEMDDKKGPAIYNYNSLAEIRNCVFTKNLAEYDGAGVYSTGGSHVKITNCLFYENKANYGAAILNTANSSSDILHSTFVNNVAADAGRGAAIYNQNSPAGFLRNSIVWNNTPNGQIINENSASFVIKDNIISGGFNDDDETNNIYNLNPVFISEVTRDFHLANGSPAMGKGDVTIIPVSLKKDLASNVRILGQAPDLGAYEFEGVKPTLQSYPMVRKTYGDASFQLADPVSNSGGTFIFKKSFDDDIIDLSGNRVTILKPGFTLINAVQSATEVFKADSIVFPINVAKLTANLVLKIDGTVYQASDVVDAKYADRRLFTLETNSDINFQDIEFDLLDDYQHPYIDFSEIPWIKAIKVGNTELEVRIPETEYYLSVSQRLSLRISKASPSISFAAIPILKVGDADYTLQATSSAGLPVTFASSDSNVASVYQDINGQWKLKVNAVGSVTITANQSGNVNYESTSNTQQVQIIENPLPVNLISFNAKATANGALLEWKTAAERNNAAYHIYRSVDGVSFTRIAEVKGAGNSSQTKYYQYIDTKPLNGINYYQLYQIDYNGDKYDLGIKDLNFSVDETVITAYPNPTYNVVTLTLPSNVYQYAEVADLSGKKLTKLQIKPKAVSVKVDLSLYPAGMYFVRLLGDGKMNTQKIIKK